jgi:hypothetical protein
VKKNMQILHGLLSSQAVDLDSRLAQEQALLNAAYKATRVRVVIKRPTNAPFLGRGDQGPESSYSVQGPVNRWDVYVNTD